MKKLLSILLVCFLILPLVGCPSEPPHVVREKVGLVVLTGQSGARGKALVSDLDEEYKEINVDVDILADGLPMGELGDIPDINRSLYIDALEPGYGDFPSEFGPEIGMGETLASAYPTFDEDYKTVIVKYTASGSTFTDHWYSNSAIADDSVASHLNFDQVAVSADGKETGPLTNNLYKLVEKAIEELNELGYEVVIEGLAFVHGEQDAKFDKNMEIYEKALTYFINDFREHFNDSNMPVVITEALTNSAKYSNELRRIQADVCEKLDNVSLIKTSDLYTNTFEPWHFGAESNIVLGNRIAAEIISHCETRVVESISEGAVDVPLGSELPQYLKAKFDNYYSGYIKVLEYSGYDSGKAGLQTVSVKVNTANGVKAYVFPVNVVKNLPCVDGNLTEYANAKKTELPNGLGELYVVKGSNGLYIAASISDGEIWTDGENWHRGDMGQKGNNDDFRIYITEGEVSKRTTLCLSAANLLRVYGKGISLNSDDVTLEFNNLVYKKAIKDYKFHVTTRGLMNCEESDGMTLELYISYKDLGINDPDNIKLCFNYNNVSSVNGVKSAVDNYLVNSNATENAEESIDSYFSINDLIK